MRSVLKISKYKLYHYNELSESAKQVVKEWYLDGQEPYIFTDMIKSDLDFLFPNSFLKVQYSLNYCQGDGLNIYGILRLHDFLEHWDADLKSKKAMYFYIGYSQDIELSENNNNNYYSCKYIDRQYIGGFINEMIHQLEYNCIRGIKINTIKNFFNDLLNYFENLDTLYENRGYDYFYNIDDDELADYCECNNFEFFENGKIYN